MQSEPNELEGSKDQSILKPILPSAENALTAVGPSMHWLIKTTGRANRVGKRNHRTMSIHGDEAPTILLFLHIFGPTEKSDIIYVASPLQAGLKAEQVKRRPARKGIHPPGVLEPG